MKRLFMACGLVASLTANAAAADFQTISLSVSPPGNRVQVAIGDVDSDGRNELVVVTASASAPQSEMLVYEVSASGATTLQQAVSLPATPGPDWTYTQPRIVDADRDGDLDVALYERADGQPGVLRLVLQSAGAFTVSSFGMPETDAAYSFDMGDIDGDGIPDAITANHGMNAPQTIFVSYGASQFATSSSYPVPFNGAAGAFGPSKRGLVHLYARDLDADGRIDIAASSAPFNNFAARILFNKPTGMVARNVAGAPSIDMAIADVTADGRVDLVMNGNQTAGLRTFRGSGFSSFTSLSTAADPRTPVIGDINRDGVRDIVFAPTFSKMLTVYIGGSGGGATTVITPELSAADFLPGSYVQELTMGDVDNDGDLDVIFATDRVIWLRHGASDATAPVLSLPASITAEATSASGASVTFAATANDETDGNVAVQCTPASGSLFALGTTTVHCSATDAAGNVANGSFAVTVRDTTAPSLTVPANLTAEATSPQGATVTFAAAAADAVSGNVSVHCTPASGSLFALGTSMVQCSAADAAGNTSLGNFTVTVRDTTAPSVWITPSVTLISPPNHKMVPVTIAVQATDAGDSALVSTIVDVTSSEAPNGRGDGNTSKDWRITGPLSVELRAERTGKGDGRVYTIYVRTADRSGNVTLTSTQVTVR